MDRRTKNDLYNKIIELLSKNSLGVIHAYINTAQMFIILNFENNYEFFEYGNSHPLLIRFHKNFFDNYNIVYLDYVEKLNAEPIVLYGRMVDVPQIVLL